MARVHEQAFVFNFKKDLLLCGFQLVVIGETDTMG